MAFPGLCPAKNGKVWFNKADGMRNSVDLDQTDQCLLHPSVPILKTYSTMLTFFFQRSSSTMPQKLYMLITKQQLDTFVPPYCSFTFSTSTLVFFFCQCGNSFNSLDYAWPADLMVLAQFPLAEMFPTVNGVQLHTAFHYHPH